MPTMPYRLWENENTAPKSPSLQESLLGMRDYSQKAGRKGGGRTSGTVGNPCSLQPLANLTVVCFISFAFSRSLSPPLSFSLSLAICFLSSFPSFFRSSRVGSYAAIVCFSLRLLASCSPLLSPRLLPSASFPTFVFLFSSLVAVALCVDCFPLS